MTNAVFFAKRTCPNPVVQDILLYPGIPGSEVQQLLQASFSLQVNKHGDGGNVLTGSTARVCWVVSCDLQM